MVITGKSVSKATLQAMDSKVPGIALANGTGSGGGAAASIAVAGEDGAGEGAAAQANGGGGGAGNGGSQGGERAGEAPVGQQDVAAAIDIPIDIA